MNDILESLFQGMDILIDKKLEDVSFDSTIICTIVDDSRKKDGVYKVTDGNVIYTVYSENDKYSNEEQVRVSILNGDYSEKKFIVGKYDINSDSTPLTYVSPLESILNLSGNLIVGDGKYGITANGQEKERYIWSTSLKNQDYINLQRNGIYDSVFLKANFKTALQNYDLIEGNYGLRVTLMIKPNPNSDSYIKRWFELDSSEMLGNPYSFLIPSTQAKVVKLDTFGMVDTIALTIYQKGNFKDSEKEYIIPQAWDNILVSDIELGFGSDLASKEDNLLEIYTTNGPTYKYANHNNDTNNKTIGLLWYNKDEHNQYIGFSDGIYDPGYDELEYLNISRMDDRLTSRMGREEVATDKESLTLLANIEEAEPLLKKALQVVDSDIPNLLRQLGTQMQTESNLFDPIDECITDVGNLAKNIKNTYIEELKKTYAQVLKYGYIIQTTGVRDGWIPLTEDYGTKIQDTFDNIFNKVLTLLNSTLITEINSNYTEFLSIYDIFKPRIEKEILTAKEYLGQGVDGITGNSSAYNSKFPQSVLNTEDYNALLKYESVKNNFKSYQQVDLTPYENRYCVYWYRYNKNYIPPASEGGIMPLGWERMTELNNIGLPGQSDFKSIVNNIEISETEKKEYLDNLKNLVSYLGDKDNKIYYNPKPDPEDGTFNVYLKHDSTEEKFVAVLFYNHDRIQSRELIFTNADVVPDKTTLDKGDILIFEHKEQSYDDYQVYSITNYLMNASDEHINRQLRCHYDGLMAKDEALVNAGIYWYVPTNSTMITVDEDYLLDECGFVKDGKILFTEDRKLSYLKGGYDCYYKQIKAKKDESGDTPTWNYIDDITGKDNRDFYYKIKPYYDHGAMQNSILCMVLPQGDPDPVYGEQFFTFGIKGTSGTKYTLSITNTSSTKITTTDSSELPLKVELRDFDNKVIPISTETSGLPTGTANGFNVSWFMKASDHGTYDIKTSGEKVTGIEFHQTGCGIAKAVASFYLSGGTIVDEAGAADKKLQLVDLEVLHNIPWSTGGYYLAGPTQIIYNSFGALDDTSLFNTPYKLFEQRTNKEVENVTWSIKYYKKGTTNPEELPSSGDTYNFYDKYLPKLNKDNSLTPSPLYLDGLEYYPVVIAAKGGTSLWKQPIIILQNRYSSSMLNDWDGTFNIDEREGTIMSSMIGAGRKTDSNTFEGVLMGEVALKAGVDTNASNIGLKNHSGLGIYGFNDGAQSFGFNVDGTAFLGKAGGGRIIFDGNCGVIASALWFQDYELPDGTIVQGGLVATKEEDNKTHIIRTGTRGMCIDLENGHIDAYNFRLTSKNIYFNSNPSWVNDGDAFNNGYFMKIGNEAKGFISLDADGNLVIRTNSFYLTGQTGSENLLRQTSPRKNEIVYQTKEIEIVLEYDEETGEKKTEKQTVTDYVYKDDGSIEYDWKLGAWGPWDGTKAITAHENIESKEYVIEAEGKIIQVTKTSAGEKYVLSGYIQSKSGEAQFIPVLDAGVIEYFSLDSEYDFEDIDKITTDGVTIDDSKWHYFTCVFIRKGSAIGFECSKPFYLWHAKLEEGTVASSWSPAAEDLEENATASVDNKVDHYLKQDVLFDKLFTDPETGLKTDGIALVGPEQTTSGIPELYINASYIATGILRSKDWDGKLKATYNTSTKKYEYKIIKNPTVGMYINLDLGKIWAATFQLEAGKKTDEQYLYLSSDNGNEATINGYKTDTWRIIAGKYFGVTSKGAMYAASGNIAGWKITEESLKKDYKAGATETYQIEINAANVGQAKRVFSVFKKPAGNTSGTYDDLSATEEGIFWVNGVGSIFAKKGTVGGWTLSEDGFWSGGTEKAPNIYLGKTGKELTINGTARTGIVFKAGANFGVTSDGTLYANGATLSGKLSAGANSTIGNWKVTSGNLQSNNGSVVLNGASGAISGSDISGGSIEIGDYFKVSTTGAVEMSGDVGFLTLGAKSGSTALHPYVSALNVCKRDSGAISFRSGTTIGSPGSQIANIGCTSAGSLILSGTGDVFLNPGNSLRVGSLSSYYTGQTFQTIVQTSNMHYVYLKFYKGVCVGVSSAKDTSGTFTDYSDSYDYV